MRIYKMKFGMYTESAQLCLTIPNVDWLPHIWQKMCNSTNLRCLQMSWVVFQNAHARPYLWIHHNSLQLNTYPNIPNILTIQPHNKWEKPLRIVQNHDPLKRFFLMWQYGLWTYYRSFYKYLPFFKLATPRDWAEWRVKRILLSWI